MASTSTRRGKTTVDRQSWRIHVCNSIPKRPQARRVPRYAPAVGGSDLPEREPPVAATESLVRPQDEQTLEPSSSPRAPMQDSSQAVPLQAGNLGTRPHASTAPATGGSLPAGGKQKSTRRILPFWLGSPQPRHSRRPRRTKPPRWCPRKGSGRTGRQLQQGRPLPLSPI